MKGNIVSSYIHSCIHKYFLSICYILRTVLGSQEACVESKLDTNTLLGASSARPSLIPKVPDELLHEQFPQNFASFFFFFITIGLSFCVHFNTHLINICLCHLDLKFCQGGICLVLFTVVAQCPPQCLAHIGTQKQVVE